MVIPNELIGNKGSVSFPLKVSLRWSSKIQPGMMCFEETSVYHLGEKKSRIRAYMMHETQGDDIINLTP